MFKYNKKNIYIFCGLKKNIVLSEMRPERLSDKIRIVQASISHTNTCHAGAY
jgi:hypothetical protein